MINCRISTHQRTLVIENHSYFLINCSINRSTKIFCASFELCYVDGIGVFFTGSQVSNLTSRFDSICLLLAFLVFIFNSNFAYLNPL